jgi:hypothetical protein
MSEKIIAPTSWQFWVYDKGNYVVKIPKKSEK